MASAEETPNANIVFRGIDGNECEAFIAAIRDRAFAQGMDEGDHWMLRYATSRLRGKAMRWHAKLDPSIRKDWDLFLQALFEEYPLVEDRDRGGIATPAWTSTTFSPASSTITLPGNGHLSTPAQPAGAEVVPHRIAQSLRSLPLRSELVPSPPVYDPSLSGFQMGRLRVLYEEGGQRFHYVSASSKRATSNILEALIVTFIPSSEPHQLVCFNCGDPKLCINLCPPNLSEWVLRPEHYLALLILIGNLAGQTPSSRWRFLLRQARFFLDPNFKTYYLGEKGYIPSEYYSTTLVYVDISGVSISFAKDSDNSRPLRATSTFSELPIVRARIVFEPL
ncbi:hypothetical protein M407DRAFT_34271 [Tulasnella calospora MUT 4182]|uniref:Retrotransposon gag domain-containing protein n=1 Tax=Tulasnella calospora MUT 4182 TaxID=1051891 RepID=A0A0C3Q0X3_9AGAM|nr:hypothetical protein M407DRAFT_34271 [Tulasnella calospora MUT 4182]